MQKYSYVALTPDGKTIKGTMIAQSDEEIKQLVTKGGNYCLSFTKVKDDSKGQKALPLKLVVNFCRQLGSILKAGLPLSSALEMLYGKTDKGPLKTAIGNIYEIVQKGNSLSDALIKQGKSFPNIMLNMVKAGEMSGDLDDSLNKLADHFEKDVKLRNQVKSAMRYPKILGIITLAVVILLVTTILPKMVGSMDADKLPATTKFLLGISDFIMTKWPILLIVVIMLYVGLPMIFNIPSVRFNVDKFKLKAPKVGKMMRMIYTARFARSLATLYDGGIQLIEAMNMATAIVGNEYVSKQMDEAI
ncbi:MAG: type II secretion system F family protein, partial [Clostridia bacterium]|nr:type II secretion system F family protein [Clostridia bacterium]